MKKKIFRIIIFSDFEKYFVKIGPTFQNRAQNIPGSKNSGFFRRGFLILSQIRN